MATTRPRGGFRHIDMTPNAWAAVIVPGAVAGLTAGRLWEAPLVLTAAGGVVLSYLLALAVDRGAGARALVTLDVSDLPEPSLEAVTARLDADGVPVTVRRWTADGPVDPGEAEPDPGVPHHAALRVASRYRLQAEAAVDVERQGLTGNGRP
ncbi:MAG: hypothetical protein R2761_11085 [Acidimicrobiales bacterium]